jgi:hypothetical protein
MVWTLWVTADLPSIIPQLQFSIFEIWTIPHITDVAEPETQQKAQCSNGT